MKRDEVGVWCGSKWRAEMSFTRGILKLSGGLECWPVKKLFESERPAVGETGVGKGRLCCLVAYPDESRLMNFEVFAIANPDCRTTSLAAQMIRYSWQGVGE